MATYHTLVLNVGTIEGANLAGAIAYVNYDRTVRTTGGVLVPSPASDGVAIPVVGDASVQVLASDDPDLMTDAVGFGINVRVVWTEAPSWRQQSKTYLAQVHVADAATVDLSDHLATVATSNVTVLQGPRGEKGDTGSTGATGPAGPAPTDSNIAPVITSGTATQAALDARARTHGDYNVAQYLPANWATLTDHTSYFQQALTDAKAANNAIVNVPQGLFYVSGLVIPEGTGLRGTSGTRADYGNIPGRGATTLSRPSGDASTNAVVALNGAGASIQNVVIRGQYTVLNSDTHGTYPNGAPTGDNGPGLYVSAFQSRIRNVFVHGFSHAGLWIDCEDDPEIDQVEVNVCGTATIPAVVVGWGLNGDGTGASGNHFLPASTTQFLFSNDSNTISFGRLVVQGCYNTLIDVGNYLNDIPSGSTVAGCCEEVSFSKLHIEGAVNTATQTSPLVIVGPRARGTRLDNFYLYAGKAGPTIPVVSYNGTPPTMPANSDKQWLPCGLTLSNGDILGSRANLTAATTQVGIDLVKGEFFSISNVRADYIANAMVQVESTYGAHLSLGVGLHMVNQSINVPVLSDLRTNRTEGLSSYGQLNLMGHLIIGRQPGIGLPVAATQSTAGAGASASVTSGSDTGALLTLTTGTSPAAGNQVTVTFQQAFNTTPYILLVPKNSISAQNAVKAWPTNITTTSFDVRFEVAPAASTTYGWSWLAYAYR